MRAIAENHAEHRREHAFKETIIKGLTLIAIGFLMFICSVMASFLSGPYSKDIIDPSAGFMVFIAMISFVAGIYQLACNA